MAPRRHLLRVLGGSTVLLVAGFACLLGANRVGLIFASPAEVAAQQSSTPTGAQPIETVLPTKGGLSKHTSQPGSAHSFESAELYAKVSGFLQKQHVDIGTRVKRGDLLAEIDIPELLKDVDSATAACQQAKAEVAQAEAQVETAIADQKGMEAKIAEMKADVDRRDAEKQFEKKQFDRLTELNDLDGIEDRVVDEKKCQLQAAEASHRAAQSAVHSAEQNAAAAGSRVNLCRADLEVARAKLLVAQTQLERAKLMASYTKITSPYDGVVTRRNFHPGAYVRAPDQGGQVPLLCVERTDKMRVVVRVPEREVPFIQSGDAAVVHFDAIPHQDFEGTVARIAEAEDPTTRTMLAEIDLPNADGRIRNHMYGRVEITLEESAKGVTVPSTCLFGDVVKGKAKLFVVENDHVQLRDVQIGTDTGIQVEVLSGLSHDEQVVVRPSGGLAHGAQITSRTASAGG